MKTIFNTLTIILILNLFNILDVGYGTIFIGYAISTAIGVIYYSIIELFKQGYQQYKDNKMK